MAKVVALIVSALCILAFAAITPANANAHAHANANAKQKHLDVIGRVYCDTCRVQFPTKLAEGIEGATVTMTCRNPLSQEKKYEKTAKTNGSGLYTIHTDGDHTDEICAVTVEKSPDDDCDEEMDGTLNKVQVDMALDDGIHQKVRYANPIGFMAKKALPGCKKVLEDMDFQPLESN